METLERTDIHKPSSIRPEDYEFTGILFDRVGIEGSVWLMQEKRYIRKHMEKTGGSYSNHEHGGSCHICGAHAVYLAVFYHQQTNVYIQTGFDCADKMHMGEADRFRRARNEGEALNKAIAGKKKAEAVLKELGLEAAWTLSRNQERPDKFEENTIHDIVRRLIAYGNISEKQVLFVQKLLKQISERAGIEAKRAEEREQAENCPSGKVVITGTILKSEWREDNWGGSIKITVKDDRGFLVWGTCPTVPSLNHMGERGDKITFTADVTPSDKDEKFGFYKRPTKAQYLALTE